MADETNNVCRLPKWRLLRRCLTTAALVLALSTVLVAAYLLVPEAVMSRGLQYETYADATGLTLGLEDLEESRKKHAMAGAGWMSPVALDAERRYLTIAAPYVRTEEDPEREFMCWAVVDTEEEK